jgi:aldose 1-epimerase
VPRHRRQLRQRGLTLEHGTILELASGPACLRLAPEAGGRVTFLRLAPPGRRETRELLLPFPEETGPDELLHWPKGGIYPLIPYGNRIRGATLRLPDGVDAETLPPHPDAAPHTLHGHAHRVPWALVRHEPEQAELVLQHPAGGEWPWRFTATQSFHLKPDVLHIRLSVRNGDRRPMPAGLGLHPYFLHEPADRFGFTAGLDWPLLPDLLGGAPVPAAAEHEQPRALPDGSVTLYRSEWDGRCSIETASCRITLKADPTFGHLVVHRPANAPYVCLEPCSHAPDGFNLAAAGVHGTGLHMLKEDEVLEGGVTISLSARS